MKRIWENQTAKAFLVFLWLFLPGCLGSAQTLWLPSLQLMATNHGVQAEWDALGYYYLLQSATDLSATSGWVNEASASPVVASNAAAFQNSNPVLLALGFTTNMVVQGDPVPINAVTCNVSMNARAKFYRMRPPTTLPLSSFAIFYEGAMEFSQTAALFINGPVHANGPIDVGTTTSLVFNSTVTCQAAVGAQLPSNGSLGFTVATPNPLYVWGNYNVQTATSATNASAATTNTSNTVSAALFCDALTVLSSHWKDAESYMTFVKGNSAYAAMDDTINAVIVTGNMPSTDSTGTGFSGGVHNLARLLEDWSSADANLWLNTSLCRLWTSQAATNQFRNPSGFNPAPVNPYYSPPMRHYNYDQKFQNPAQTPPGVPLLNLNIGDGF